MSIKDRVLWACYRRSYTIKRVVGLHAHWATYVSKNSQLSEYVHLKKGASISNSHIGRFSRINGCSLDTVDVGSFCSIAPRSRIGGGGEHPLNQISTHSVFYMSNKKEHPKIQFVKEDKFDSTIDRVRIGNDVWIGSDVIVKQGIHISDGAVVASGSVVVKDIPPYAIVGGVPAKVIKYRHESELISLLIKSEWWNWDINSLQKITEVFDANSKLTVRKFNELLKSIEDDIPVIIEGA